MIPATLSRGGVKCPLRAVSPHVAIAVVVGFVYPGEQSDLAAVMNVGVLGVVATVVQFVEVGLEVVQFAGFEPEPSTETDSLFSPSAG